MVNENIDELINNAPTGNELQSLVNDGRVYYQQNMRFTSNEDQNKHNFRYTLNELVNKVKSIIDTNIGKKPTFDYDFRSFVKSHESQFEKSGDIFIGAVLKDKNQFSLISARDGELLLNLH